MVMPKQPVPPAVPAEVVPLSPSVRRHLGQNLRSLYAETLAAPVSQRLEALVAQLDKPKR